MPPQAPKLPDAELAVIKRWIDGGLLENTGSKALVSKKPKVDLALKIPTAAAAALAQADTLKAAADRAAAELAPIQKALADAPGLLRAKTEELNRTKAALDAAHAAMFNLKTNLAAQQAVAEGAILKARHEPLLAAYQKLKPKAECGARGVSPAENSKPQGSRGPPAFPHGSGAATLNVELWSLEFEFPLNFELCVLNFRRFTGSPYGCALQLFNASEFL